MRQQIQLPSGASGRKTGLVFTTKDLDNMYPQRASSSQERAQYMLRGTPGLNIWQADIGGPCRGQLATKNALYVVMGQKLYEMRKDNANNPEDVTPLLSGNLAGSDAVRMAWNSSANQLAIVAGNTGYIFNPAARTFVEITDPAFLTPRDVTFIDGYFVFAEANSNILFTSALNDGTSYNALDRLAMQRTDGDLIAVSGAFSTLWAFSENTTELLRNVGNNNPPFSPLGNTVFEVGCVATASVVRVPAVGMMWLAPDGMVYARGDLNAVVTPYEVAEEIAAYSRIDDAEAWHYTYGRHRFYVLQFPSAGACWVYDITEDAWHKRSSFGKSSYRATHGVFYDRKVIVGDRFDNELYQLTDDTYTEFGEPIRRTVITPPIHADGDGLTINNLLLILETGTQAPTANGDITIQVSTDGGLTFNTIYVGEIARHGNYVNNLEIDNLGFFPNAAVLKIQTAADCPIKIVAGYIDADKALF